MTDFRIVPREARDLLGEGPIWSSRAQCVFWVDIFGQQLWSLSAVDDSVRSWTMPDRLCWVVERAGRGGLLAGFRREVAELSLDPVTIVPRFTPEPDRPQNRLNDAKVDHAGRLWFGSKDDNDQQASGALYSLDGDGRRQRHDDGYAVANGPAFSPDGRWLYHTDSGQGVIFRFALGGDGMLGPREEFIRFEPGWGAPDGMTTDADGHLWIAHWGGGRVSRFDPAGRLDRSIALPATNITSCAFGGDGLDRLFVTSAAWDAGDEPHGGALFEIDPGAIGLPPMAFAG